MRIGITVGHTGRPHKQFKDLGAAKAPLVEVYVVRQYVAALERALHRLGCEVVVLSDGEYSDQWKRVDSYNCDVYLNCHMNAGGGDRGEFFYDHRSTRGKALAEKIVSELKTKWPNRAVACRPDDDGEPRDEDYSEAYGCICGVKAVALVVEGYFIDGPRISEFVSGIEAWAESVAQALKKSAL